MQIERFSLGGQGGIGAALEIGLVNNMPDVALRATELQFARLLKDAAGALDVRLHLFSLAGIERGAAARARMEGFYADAATLPEPRLDALIVSGAEPRPGDMRREPWWPGFAALTDWSRGGTISTVFSCLAAHAAVLHLDGIERRPLPQKFSGVVACERVREDALFTGLPAIIPVPHSRRNGLAEDDLAAHGYQVLSRLPYGDPDIFIRRESGLMVLMQGHPEFDADTLGREFLHDTGRFLRGECAERPAMPENYFDRATEEALHDLTGHAVDAAILPRYAEIVTGALPIHSWHDATVRLFANWLTLVAAEKTRRAVVSKPSRRRARA